MSITLSITKVKEILTHVMTHAPHQPVMLWGPPGIGKSAIIQQVAAGAGRQVQDLRLSQMDPPDLND